MYVFWLAHSLALAASVVLSGKLIPENLRSSYSLQVFELGRVTSFMTIRPLDYSTTIDSSDVRL